ncbi:MAG: hypothetical protein R3E79_53740 [Caldilineaceae bacterium]
MQKLEELDIIQCVSISMFTGPTEPMLTRFITYQYDFEIRKLSSAKATEKIQQEVGRELRRMTNIMGRFAEIVVGAVMKGFHGQTLDGPRYFSTPDPVTALRFNQIENRWGVLADDRAKELDLIGEYRTLRKRPRRGSMAPGLCRLSIARSQ